MVGGGIFAVAACTSFSGEPAVEISDGGDAGGADAPIPLDAPIPSDGPVADAGAPAPKCPDDALFCDNFERADMPQETWDVASNPNPTARLSLQKKDAYSGERALRVDVDMNGGSAYLLKNITAGVTSTTTLRFAVRYDAPPSADVVIAVIKTVASDLYIIVVPSGAVGVAEQSFVDGGPLTSATKTFPIRVGKWRTVVLEYVQGNPSTIKANVDGDLFSRPAQYATGAPTYIQIGSIFAKPGSASSFLVDELVLTTK